MSRAFFKKSLDRGAIPVRASGAVDDRALAAACGKINMMPRNIPKVRRTLIRKGAEPHVIGRDEQTSDLPEFRHERGRTYVDDTGQLTRIDQRARGMGGLSTSRGEENILHPPSDRYAGGNDICIHEFAHTIMNEGMAPGMRKQIAAQFISSTSAGLWAHAYAATDPREFWAELSNWYFGTHGDRRMRGTPPADGPEGLRAYDPGAFALLSRLYNAMGR